MTYIGKRLASSAGQAYQWVIEGDIASYFDTIPHRRLIKAVKKRVADRDIRDLLWKFLRAGVRHQGTIQETLSGTPQGGIVSPLLANIYLHELDTYMESTSLNLTKVQREKRRRHGQGNALYVRYCDDFVVFWNGTKAGSPPHQRGPWRIPQHHGADVIRGQDKRHPYNRRLRLSRIQGHKE